MILSHTDVLRTAAKTVVYFAIKFWSVINASKGRRVNILITHVSMHENQLTEVGAMSQGRVVWRASIAEAVQRVRAGVRPFVHHEAKDVPVEVVPATALRDATLRTAADKVTFELLKALPKLPRADKSRW